MILAMKNNPEEQNPWPTMINIAPFTPHGDMVKIPPTTKAMWATEDRAIKNLMSL